MQGGIYTLEAQMRDYEVQKRLILYGNIVINVGGYIGSSTRSEI